MNYTSNPIPNPLTEPFHHGRQVDSPEHREEKETERASERSRKNPYPITSLESDRIFKMFNSQIGLDLKEIHMNSNSTHVFLCVTAAKPI